jgi:protein-S-isoprenylcysteine O-methyltransferase Ste14
MIRLSPPRIYQGFILLMVVIYLLMPATRVILFPVNLLGIPVFVVGAWLAVAARKQFVAHQTPVPFSDNTNFLHTDGLYRFTRNPMYLGITIGLLGVALIFSSYLNFIFPLLFMIWMDRFYIAREEQVLLSQFGEQYTEFRKRVRRWI